MSQLYLYIIIWQFPYRSWYHTHSSISILVSYSEFHIGPGIILRVPYWPWYYTQSSISVLVSYFEFHIGPGIILRIPYRPWYHTQKFHIGPGIMLKIPHRSWYHTQSSILTLLSYSEFHIGPRTDAKIAVGYDMLWYEYIWKWRD